MEMHDEISVGFQWSHRAAQKAKTQNKFIWVGEYKIFFKYMTNAIELWISDNIDERNSLFNTEYRIAGTSGDIAISLINSGVSNDEIKNILSNSVTKDNYNTSKKTEFLEELYTSKINKSLVEKKIIHSGFKWSLEEATNANDSHTFFRIDNNGKICSYRPLSHALRSWDSDGQQDEIFNLQYRITGNPLNIINLLKSCKYSDNEIEHIINDSITKNNYNSSKKIEYLQELQKYRKFKSKEGRNKIHEAKQQNFNIKQEDFFLWTIQKFEKARDENKYIYLRSDSYLTLSDIMKFWNSDEEHDIVLNLEYRVVGFPKDITIVLEYFCYPINKITKILKNSINKDNYALYNK